MLRGTARVLAAKIGFLGDLRQIPSRVYNKVYTRFFRLIISHN